MGTEFRVGHIQGRSRVVEDPAELNLQNYDALIVGSSWDTRSIWISGQRKLTASVGILMTYCEEDPAGQQRRHNDILEGFLRSTCNTVQLIKGDSHEIGALWDELNNYIDSAVRNLDRPFRLCCDLTAIPRFCSLATLAGAFASGRADKVTFVYAAGEYGKPSSKDEVSNFHKGDWKAIPIPFLGGRYDPLKRRHYLVSVGFEGRQTYRVVLDGEPDRVSILFPRPGMRPEYVKRASYQNTELIKDCCVPKDEIISAHAGDAIEAWKKLQEAAIERPGTENTFFLCCGTKPHALGLALRALIYNDATVLYYIAESHSVTDVKPIGRYWRYDIIDLSVTNRTQEGNSPSG